jgi:hypothetical protein
VSTGVLCAPAPDDAWAALVADLSDDAEFADSVASLEADLGRDPELAAAVSGLELDLSPASLAARATELRTLARVLTVEANSLSRSSQVILGQFGSGKTSLILAALLNGGFTMRDFGHTMRDFGHGRFVYHDQETKQRYVLDGIGLTTAAELAPWQTLPPYRPHPFALLANAVYAHAARPQRPVPFDAVARSTAARRRPAARQGSLTIILLSYATVALPREFSVRLVRPLSGERAFGRLRVLDEAMVFLRRLLIALLTAVRLLVALLTLLRRVPPPVSFLLVVLAVMRHYGLRSESDDHAFPSSIRQWSWGAA